MEAFWASIFVLYWLNINTQDFALLLFQRQLTAVRLYKFHQGMFAELVSKDDDL